MQEVRFAVEARHDYALEVVQKQRTAKTLSFEPSSHSEETTEEAETEPLIVEETHDSPVVNRPAALLGELGEGAYFHGSAAEMKQLPDSCVGFIATSLPLSAEGIATTQGKCGDAWKAYRNNLHAVFVECKRVLESGGRIAVALTDTGFSLKENLCAEIIALLRDELKLLFRGEIVWGKSKSSVGAHAWGSFAKASNPLLRVVTERIVVFSKDSSARALTVKERRDQGLPFESTLSNDEFLEAACDHWRIGSVSAEEESFPVDLVKRLIDLYSYEGDIVLDPFAGSGSTLVAAAASGRIGVGYDADAQNVEHGQQRLACEVGPLLRRRKKYLQVVSLASSAKDIARTALEEAGFFVLESKKHRTAAECVLFDFCIRNTYGQSWWVDVVGGYNSVNPGLADVHAAVEFIGRTAIASGSEKAYPVLALTSALPLQGSKAQKALAVLGADRLFDAIDLLDPSGLDRLAHYGDGGAQQPGFWAAAELNKN